VADTDGKHRCQLEDQTVFNIEMARLKHRHGDEWVEMSPVAAHSPDARDPERRLLAGARVYRCEGCDEEMQVTPPEISG
jgi:hypothetical protein